MTVDEFLSELDCVKKTPRGWSARCPAHDDSSPSLAIAEGDDGRILVRCWSGCPADKIVASLGLRLAHLFAAPVDEYATSWVPSTPEERQRVENTRLRREVSSLKRDRLRADYALHRAALLIGIAYSDDPEGVLDRLWRGATDQLEAEASALADAAA